MFYIFNFEGIKIKRKFALGYVEKNALRVKV
jgi:hypothetical protein